jgi:hypothetical protein
MSRVSVIVVLSLFLGDGLAWGAAPNPASAGTERSARGDRPLSVTLYMNLLLVSGVRVARRVAGDRDEVAAFVGNAVSTGCGIQAPTCEDDLAIGLGARRYLSADRLTAYAGVNLYYLGGGIRFAKEAHFMPDLVVGAHWQSYGGFTFGLGYSVFIFDTDEEGFALDQQGWLLIEIGKAF